MELIFVVLVVITYGFVLLSIRQKMTKVFFLLVGGYWCVSLILSLFNPYELFPVSPGVYALVSLGYISCFVGFVSKHKKVKCFQIPLPIDEQVEHIFHTKFFQISFVISFILVGYLVSTQWAVILLQGGLGNLKLDLFELVFHNNSGLYFLYHILAFPVFHLSTILLSYIFIKGGNVKVAIVLLLYVVLFCVLGGKRGHFATVLEYFVFISVISVLISRNRNAGELKSLVFKFAIAVSVALIGAAYMTSLSGGADFDKERMKESNAKNIENLIVYNIGAYRAFDYAINHGYLNKAGGYQLGRASFGRFLDYYGAPILSKLGFRIQRETESTMKLLQDNDVPIGNNRTFVFIFTSFMYFYFDFGILGVLFIPLLFGRFLRYCIDLSIADNSIVSLTLISYLFISCILFIGSWFFVGLSAQPILLYLYVIRKKQKKYFINYGKRFSENNHLQIDSFEMGRQS